MTSFFTTIKTRSVATLTVAAALAIGTLAAGVPATASPISTADLPGAVSIAATTTVQRLSGADRYATAVAVSATYPVGVPVVYIASGANFPDALSAAPAAAHLGGPLLLTSPGSLPAIVHDEIARLQPTLIVVTGGTASISDGVYGELAGLADSIRRDAGADRYATSRAVNAAAFPGGSTGAYVATGRNFPDALSASAAAGSTNSPVLLVNGTDGALDGGTRTLINSLGVTHVTLAGGTAAVSSSIENDLSGLLGTSNVRRQSGADRYQTSSAINRGSFTSSPTVYLATGTGFADALAGAALAGRNHAALYVVPSNCVSDATVSDMQALGTTQRILLGGANSLNADVEANLACSALPVPAPEPAPAPAPVPSAPGNPGNTKNCSDFANWNDAQTWYLTYKPYYGDIAQLDGDDDGIACENLPGHP